LLVTVEQGWFIVHEQHFLIHSLGLFVAFRQQSGCRFWFSVVGRRMRMEIRPNVKASAYS
jgi:uncharacterized membrane protein